MTITLISCGQAQKKPINNYCLLHSPVTATPLDTCETIEKLERAYCKYDKICGSYKSKSFCEAKNKTYTAIKSETLYGNLEILCSVKKD